MRSLGWLTGCALACAHESKGVVGIATTDEVVEALPSDGRPTRLASNA